MQVGERYAMHGLVRALIIRNDDRPFEHILGEILTIPGLIEFTANPISKLITVRWTGHTGHLARFGGGQTLVIMPDNNYAVLSQQEVINSCVLNYVEPAEDVKTNPTESETRSRGCFS